MNNLNKLKNDLEAKAQADYENNSDNYIEGEFTEEDQAVIDQMKAEQEDHVVVVSDQDADGNTVQQPISEYAKSLDERVTEIKDQFGNSEIIKTVNSGDIVKSTEELQEEVKNQAIQMYRQLANQHQENETLTDEQLIDMNNRTIERLMDYFKLPRLTSDDILPKLKKMTLRQLVTILPTDFVYTYISDREVQANNTNAKERLLAAIGYLTVTGPEMDYLNEYIENENKLALVSQRILRCQMDFAEMLKDEKTLSELVSKTIEIAPNDETFWSKYIKLPNRIHNEFAQRAVLQQKYLEAYTKLLEEYPVDTDDDKTNAFNQKARAVIQEEIDEAKAKSEVYQSITNLDLLKELYTTLSDRYMNHGKLNQKFLEKECMNAIDRAKRCKQNVPYPGYNGNMVSKKTDFIYRQYMREYVKMLSNYNTTLLDVYQREATATGTTPDTKIQAIALPPYDGQTVHKVFALVLSILMGRVMKKCTENTATKYDAIILDSYFKIFCSLGMDIYTMTEIWELVSPLVKYLLENVKFDSKFGW